MNTENLLEKWRHQAGEVSRISAEITGPSQEAKLLEAWHDTADLEREITDCRGDASTARLKLEISLNYATIAGVVDDPAWDLVRSALNDLGGQRVLTEMEASA